MRDVWTGYDDQYLMIEAMPAPAGGDGAGSFEPAGIDADWRRRVDRFARLVPQVLDDWRAGLAQGHRRGLRTLLWGGGSKAVAFLTTLGAGDEIAAAVDINPLKRGTFLAGTGHPVIGPQDVAGLAPDRIVIMNPIYVSEVA
ncbi:MAG TPA: hypothetical protein VK943_02025, partial [Arenibaculum sp.]|nr:hypothetical protein [Arenibaculum sp.]